MNINSAMQSQITSVQQAAGINRGHHLNVKV